MPDATSGPTPEILTDAGSVTTGAAATVLPAGDVTEPGHRSRSPRRRGLVIGGAVVGAALVCGAGLAVAAALSGGGTQPEDVLPAGVVAFADVDLDPPAGQKVNTVRFLRSFPQWKDVADSSADLRTTLVDALFGRSGIDPATQIDPWLGDRAGIALVRQGDNLDVVGVLQTTDTKQATSSLNTLLAGQSDGTTVGFAVSGDYVVVARSAADAQRIVDAGAQHPLSADPTFTSALDGFGDGVASFYVDGGAAKGVSSVQGQPVPTQQLSQLTSLGLAAGIVRFDPDAVELLARSSGGTTKAVADRATTLVTSLPDTTIFALGSASDRASVAEGLDRLLRQVDAAAGMDTAAMVQRRFGVRLPQDAVTLLGDDRVVAVDGGSAAAATGMPSIGYRSVTDPAAAAELVRRLDPLVQQLTGGLGLVARPTADGLVVATTPQYAAALAAGDGGLGATSVFRDAVPDAGQAAAIGYLDLNRLAALMHVLSGDADTAALDPLSAVGLSVTVDGATTSYRLRVTLG
jgi:hypothetical protein